MSNFAVAVSPSGEVTDTTGIHHETWLKNLDEGTASSLGIEKSDTIDSLIASGWSFVSHHPGYNYIVRSINISNIPKNMIDEIVFSGEPLDVYYGSRNAEQADSPEEKEKALRIGALTVPREFASYQDMIEWFEANNGICEDQGNNVYVCNLNGENFTYIDKGDKIFRTAVTRNFDYACLMLNFDEELADAISRLADTLLEEDWLYTDKPGYGKEEDIHVTVKYGLHDHDLPKMQDFLKKWMNGRKIKMTLKKVSKFDSNPDYDVIKLDVDSKDLEELNKAVSENFPNTETHPEYIPHITLAYVKKDMGDGLIGNESFDGEDVESNTFDFADKDAHHAVFTAARRKTADWLDEAIMEFFKDNPDPTDEEIHELAESTDMDPSILEERIYGLFGKHVGMMEKQASIGQYDDVNVFEVEAGGLRMILNQSDGQYTIMDLNGDKLANGTYDEMLFSKYMKLDEAARKAELEKDLLSWKEKTQKTANIEEVLFPKYLKKAKEEFPDLSEEEQRNKADKMMNDEAPDIIESLDNPSKPEILTKQSSRNIRSKWNDLDRPFQELLTSRYKISQEQWDDDSNVIPSEKKQLINDAKWLEQVGGDDNGDEVEGSFKKKAAGWYTRVAFHLSEDWDDIIASIHTFTDNQEVNIAVGETLEEIGFEFKYSGMYVLDVDQVKDRDIKDCVNLFEMNLPEGFDSRTLENTVDVWQTEYSE